MLIYFLLTNKREIDLQPIPDGGIEVEVQLRALTSILRPTFIMTDKNTPKPYKFNYIYVPEWNRAYFISAVEIEGNLYYINCNEDYLSSWYTTIIDQEFYCMRATNIYNNRMSDGKYPTESIPVNNLLKIDTPWCEYDKGIYILGVTGGENEGHIGGVTYYAIDPENLDSFMQDLLTQVDIDDIFGGGITDALNSIFNSLCKSIADPVKYIQSLIYIPLENLSITYELVDEIPFGIYKSKFDTPVKRILPDNGASLATKFDMIINASFLDEYEPYQRKAPFTELLLYAPPFGMIEIPDSAIEESINTGSFDFEITIDTITGNAILSVKVGEGSCYITTCQIGVDVGVTQITQDIFGAIQKDWNGLKALTHASLLNTTGYIIDGLESMQPAPSCTGANGGYALLKVNDYWVLEAIHHTQQTAYELFGRPLCTVVKPSQLTGFCNFDNPHVKGAMWDVEEDNINHLLAEGVYVTHA